MLCRCLKFSHECKHSYDTALHLGHLGLSGTHMSYGIPTATCYGAGEKHGVYTFVLCGGLVGVVRWWLWRCPVGACQELSRFPFVLLGGEISLHQETTCVVVPEPASPHSIHMADSPLSI